MTSKERLDGYLAGKAVDRRPNLTIVGSVVTQYIGISVDRYCLDWKAMAESAAKAAVDLRLDYIQIASDLAREAEGVRFRFGIFAGKASHGEKVCDKRYFRGVAAETAQNEGCAPHVGACRGDRLCADT